MADRTPQTFTAPLMAYRITPPPVGSEGALSLCNLPLGSQLTDGHHSASITQPNLAVDISHWQHTNLQLHLPSNTAAPASVQLLIYQQGQQRRSNLPLQPLAPEAPTPAVEPEPNTDTITSSPALHLSGLPKGARLTDGRHTLTAHHPQQTHNLLEWNLTQLRLQPPLGWHQPINLHIQPHGLTATQTAALGPINIRLLSPNAYRVGGTTPADETHLPAQEISLQNLTPERPSSLVISIGQGAQPLIQATAQIELDDEGLAALERKERGK